MSGSRRPKMDHKPSIKCAFSLPDKGAVDFADFDLKICENHQSKIPKPRNSAIFGTRELISAISSIYDQSVRPHSVLLPKCRRRINEDSYQDCGFLCHFPEEMTWISFSTAENQNLSFNLTRTSPKLKKLSVRDKLLLFKPSCGTESLLRTLLNNSPRSPLESRSTEGLSSLALASLLKFRKLYTSDTALDDPNDHVSYIVKDKHERDDCASAIFHAPLHEATSVDDRIRGNANSYVTNNQHIVSSLAEHESLSLPPSGTDHIALSNVQDSAVQIRNSKPTTDSVSHVTSSVSDNLEESELSVSVDNNSKSETCLPVSGKPHYLLANQEHAYAGAMAGTCVSLCLHPIDTIKTVVQSCRANQTSIYNVSRSIISERGAMGLYRGISSNIASSAPISAVYTFTYESVKGTLLSVFPKEYQSLAHCIAGGSASVATSFIFTPSERIKQQMQVGLRYQNCWNAMIGIVEKGGFLSLYAGWGAVLCRNVPHSIIKFYTYESLKQMLTPVLSNGQMNQTSTLVTLVSGGFAGSIAALMTTPFDVVKTRLQTQKPGFTNQSQSVLAMLKDIAMNEGLKGLYRGLIPRLVMYISQGGLFFASYEFLKTFFSPENIPTNIKKVQKVEQKQRNDDGFSICMLVN